LLTVTLAAAFLLAAGCSDSSPSPPVTTEVPAPGVVGTEQACTLYRDVAGSVDAGNMTATEFTAQAEDIAAAAHQDTDPAVTAAADTLLAAAQALAAAYPSGLPPIGPELTALTTGEQGVLQACSQAGY